VKEVFEFTYIHAHCFTCTYLAMQLHIYTGTTSPKPTLSCYTTLSIRRSGVK